MKKSFYLVAIIGLVLAFLISRAIVNTYENPANSDFFTFWLAGRLVSRGMDPYSVFDWVSGHHVYGSTWFPNLAYVYPLPLSILFIPLGAINFEFAFTVWVAITIILLGVTLILLLNYFEEEYQHFILPLIAGLVLFRPITSLIRNGQISAVLLLIFIIAGILWDQKKWFLGGMIIALSLMKPNLGLIVVALCAWHLLLQHRYSALLGIGVTGISLLLIGMAIDPEWLSQYYNILLIKYNQTFGYSPTIWGLSFQINSFEWNTSITLGAILTAIVIIGYLIFIWKDKNIPSMSVIAFATLVMLLITPYLWPYDQIILLLPIVLSMSMLRKNGVSYLGTSMIFIMISIISYYLFWRSTIIRIENINVFLTLLVLALFTLTNIMAKYRQIQS